MILILSIILRDLLYAYQTNQLVYGIPAWRLGENVFVLAFLFCLASVYASYKEDLDV